MKIYVSREDDSPDDMVCPYCCSEDITMSGDPEYNDMWACWSCDEEFSSWIERKDFNPQQKRTPGRGYQVFKERS